MPFDGTEGGFITLDTGREMTKSYRDSAPAGAIRSVFLGKEKLDELLRQNGAMGLRFYFAKDQNGAMALVVVSANAEQNDQLGTNDKILDIGAPCPGNGCPSSTSSLQV